MEETMSDVSSGARAPDVPTYATASGGGESTARQVAGQGAHAAGQAAGEVKDTATQQARRVGAEAKIQARNVASDVRDRVSGQARTQNDKLVSSIRQTAGQLDEMRGDRRDSPAATVVSRVADGGRQFADYLDRYGPEGVLRDAQDFARRRPGAFLAATLAAGFLVGRLGKGVAKADPEAGSGKPRDDSFVSAVPDAGSDTGSTGYAGMPSGDAGYSQGTTVSTEYAATGTGRPVVVEQEYVPENPADRR
jgi:hypothetical protein